MIKKTFIFKDKKSYKRFMDRAGFRVMDGFSNAAEARKASFKLLGLTTSIKSSMNNDEDIRLAVAGQLGSEAQKRARVVKDAAGALVSVIGGNVERDVEVDSAAVSQIKNAAKKLLAAVQRFEATGSSAPDFKDIAKRALQYIKES